MERLEGDNQYLCAFCEAKVDATRQLRLRSVPPYLCLSLQRFVFDLKARAPRQPLPPHAFGSRMNVLAVRLCAPCGLHLE